MRAALRMATLERRRPVLRPSDARRLMADLRHLPLAADRQAAFLAWRRSPAGLAVPAPRTCLAMTRAERQARIAVLEAKADERA